MYKTIFLLFCLLTVNTAFGLNQGGYYKVTHLYSWTNGEGHVWVENGGAHECTDQTYPTRYLLHVDAKKFTVKFSLLLSARITGEGVNMNYTCKNGKPYIDAIRL